jgi:mono/diheme cytochrome c family protein
MRFLSLGLLLLIAAAPPAKQPPPTSSMPSRRASDPEIGETLWKQSCWQCHGESGKGDGPAAASVVGGVPSLEGRIIEENFDELVEVIQAGKGRMPGFSETMEKQDSRRILIYLKDRMAGKPPPSQTKKSDKSEDEKEKPEGNPEGIRTPEEKE